MLSISIVVIFHELGHYLVARMNKATVKEFSVGFGPDIISYTDKRQTKWTIKMLPLGGYVHCEEGNLKFLSKIILYLGGPMGNFVFSALVSSFLFLQFGTQEQKLYLHNQEIISINKLNDQFQQKENLLDSAKISQETIESSNSDEARVARYKVIFADKTEKLIEGIKNIESKISYKKIGFIQSIAKGTKYSYMLFYLNAKNLILSIKNMSLKGIGGPLKVLKATNSVVSKYEYKDILMWLIMLSAGLGVINLLPVLPLDGGRIAYELFNLISSKLAQIFCYTTMYLGLGIMILIMLSDLKGMIL
ncbi:M50 family metallopeptidase [Candidatus Cytomitobacter indipagum]|nr:M50 family metallopeptidase [Candidatus Cytomitobacter indipagum]